MGVLEGFSPFCSSQLGQIPMEPTGPFHQGKCLKRSKDSRRKEGSGLITPNSSLPCVSPQLLPPFTPLSLDLSCGPLKDKV